MVSFSLHNSETVAYLTMRPLSFDEINKIRIFIGREPLLDTGAVPSQVSNLDTYTALGWLRANARSTHRDSQPEDIKITDVPAEQGNARPKEHCSRRAGLDSRLSPIQEGLDRTSTSGSSRDTAVSVSETMNEVPVPTGLAGFNYTVLKPDKNEICSAEQERQKAGFGHLGFEREAALVSEADEDLDEENEQLTPHLHADRHLKKARASIHGCRSAPLSEPLNIDGGQKQNAQETEEPFEAKLVCLGINF